MGTKNGNLRNLQGALTTRCFTYCVEESLTPDQCVTYIEEQVAGAGGHEVGPITVKIQVPRTEASRAETYWTMEVPVNANGQMTCDRNEGNTAYPFLWENGGPGVDVPTVACQGLGAGQCCVKIRELGQLLGKDENNNCLACFVHQEPLIPDIGAGITVEYGDYEWDGSSCNALFFSPEQVGAADDATGVAVVAAAAVLRDFIANPDCGDFSSLLTALYDAAVVIPALPQYIGRLACDFCYYDGSQITTPTPASLVDMLAIILGQLDPSPEFDSIENCVIIYTNKNGQIAEIPKLGGSRADDPYDEDCPPDLGADAAGAPDDGINEDELEADPACYTPFDTDPDNLLGTYIKPTDVCVASSVDKTNDHLGYSITLIGTPSVAEDGSATKFTYEVCTAEKDCADRRLNGPQFRSDAAISHFNIGIQGSCTITGFAMYDLNSMSQGGDFPSPADTAYAIGKDPTTCVPGFKFDSGWDVVADSGCETKKWCRFVMVEVSGSVPSATGEGVIKASTGFTVISDLSIPDCSSACG